MLGAPLLRRRGFWPIWSGREAFLRARSHGANRAQPLSNQSGGRRNQKERPGKQKKEQEQASEVKQPSLIEQLFPEENKRYEEAQARQEREVPRLPLETVARNTPADRLALASGENDFTARKAMRNRRTMELQEAKSQSQTSVLVLLNASKNLTEEDFRRLIPQGKHLEGWTLQQGDILQIIPGRNLATLEQENFYYLLFSSPLSAYVYQGHATKISRLAAQQTPNALHTALAPKAGYMMEGMDVEEAIQAYTLTPSTQSLMLRQLKPPLSPLIASIIRNGGYSSILNRPDRMPYEVRLTLEGPQLPMSRIRYIVYESGRDRALGWSGGDEANVKISKYEPKPSNIPDQPTAGGIERAADSPKVRTEQSQMSFDMSKSHVSVAKSDEGEHVQRRRTANPVYILGFHTEHAAQSFIRYWHRKPMDWAKGSADEEGDLAPIANVELLW